jgi:hypothetical protein
MHLRALPMRREDEQKPREAGQEEARRSLTDFATVGHSELDLARKRDTIGELSGSLG